MCLATPGKVISIDGDSAIVDFDGIKKKVNISFVDCKEGDYILVHVGFAIEKVDRESVDYMNKLKEIVDGTDS